MSARVTLKTIADELGVSRTTVSNAYNKPDELSLELRDRILATARRLGYRGPDPAARMLRTGKMGTIGLVFTDDLRFVFSDPDTTGFMRGVAETTAASSIGLSLLPVPRDVDPVASALATAPVDGYLVFSVASDHPALDLVLRAGVPVVVVDEPDLGDRASFVGIDDHAGARAAADHVIALGHRHVALLAHRTSIGSVAGRIDDDDVMAATVRVSRMRLEAYRQRLAAVGLAPVAIWQTAGSEQDAGRDAATALLTEHPETTALLCTTDQIAIGAIRAANVMGLRVPEDLSVVGFDDVPGAATCVPSLTTIRQPIVDKGRVAADLLLEQIRSGTRCRIELPIELVVRDSTGPAPR
jgi:DNA-binding LacI/PurR family transcriptional regulator